jgi:hypothetical protein
LFCSAFRFEISAASDGKFNWIRRRGESLKWGRGGCGSNTGFFTPTEGIFTPSGRPQKNEMINLHFVPVLNIIQNTVPYKLNITYAS